MVFPGDDSSRKDLETEQGSWTSRKMVVELSRSGETGKEATELLGRGPGELFPTQQGKLEGAVEG